MDAASTFQRKRARFSTYAWKKINWTIQGAISKAYAESGRNASLEPPKPIEERDPTIPCTARDDPYNHPSNEPDPEQRAIARERAAALADAIPRLTAIEVYVLYNLYFAGRSLVEIAKEIGFHKDAVSRIHNRALRRLRSLLQKRRLEPAA